MLWKNTQHSWKGGQFDRAVMGRSDLAKYPEAASVLENFIVKRQGCISKRRGTDEVADLKNLLGGTVKPAKLKLIPLVYEKNEGYYVLMTRGRAFLAGKNGIRLMDGSWSHSIEPYELTDYNPDKGGGSGEYTGTKPFSIRKFGYDTLAKAFDNALNGDVIKLGGKIAKNSSGYALKDLIVGSEGTLGVVTKATLRLLPLPKFKISLLVPFPDLKSAISTVPLIIRSSSVPTAVEFMEREVILAAEKFQARKFPDNSADAYLLLTFDGMSQQEIDLAYETVAKTCLEAGALDVFISDTQERNESIWSARGAFLEAIKASTTDMDECDVVVPRSKVAEFVIFSHELQKKHNVRIRSFGHAGDGNLHIYVLKDDLGEEAWKKTLAATFADLYAKAKELGGQVSGEHGIGFAKKPFLAESLAPEVRALMRGIKRVFDPKGILNPHKVIAD